MKRFIAIILSTALLFTGCASQSTGVKSSPDSSAATESIAEDAKGEDTEEKETNNVAEAVTAENASFDLTSEDLAADTDDSDEVEEYHSLSDPRLLQYIEDNVYTDLVHEYQSEDYVIENVNAVYVSEDYLEETAYNSKSNIFFGYTLEELNEQFQGTPYVFTLGNDGNTIVVPFENYDDTYDQVIKNVAVGTGVILVCVTVSVITGGAGAVPVSMVFAAAAKTGTTVALSSGVISAAFTGAVTGIQTKDVDKALKAAALQGSNGFKWGAITGALAGGISQASALRNATKIAEDGKAVIDKTAPAWRQAEQRAHQYYGGKEQVTYMNGEEVPFGTPGATRPDLVIQVGDHIEAIEVKYYDLASPGSRSELYSELRREVADRVANLPPGSTQRVCLDVTDRGFSPELVQEVATTIQSKLSTIYSNIPVDIVGL